MFLDFHENNIDVLLSDKSNNEIYSVRCLHTAEQPVVLFHPTLIYYFSYMFQFHKSACFYVFRKILAVNFQIVYGCKNLSQ